MSKKNLSRTERLISLHEYLALKTPGGGVALDELVNKYGVTERQIYRDLDTLENALSINIIRPTRGQKQTGRYKLDGTFNFKIGPDAAAIIMLSVLTQKGSPLSVGLNEIKDLLIAALFKNRYGCCQEELENLQQRVYVVEEQLFDEEKYGAIVLKIMNAIKDNNVISILYYTPSRGEWNRRHIEPYGISSKHNTWYVVGYCRKSKGIRTFRIDLIDHVSLLNERFQFPHDFCLKNYFGDSWGVYSSDKIKKIKIKVGPELAHRFKRIAYHPSQNVEKDLNDGSIIVSYEASGIFEFTGWLLQWGDLVEVLEPEELRIEMRKKAGNLLKRYQ